MEDKYIIKCEHYRYVTHGGDCCSHESAICPNKGLPCVIKIEEAGFHIDNNFLITKNNKISEELMNVIDNNDLAWATANLQSNNVYKKITAKYLMDNN